MKTIFLKILLTGYLFSLFINVCSGKNIFVNPSLGSDISGNGLISKPYRSLDKAGQVAIGGDSILLREGNHIKFKNNFIRWDNGNQTIYIFPYNNENVVLNGQDTNFADWEAVLNINSSRYLEIRNLQIKNNNNSSGIRVVSDFLESRFVKILNCSISNTWRQGILIQACDVTVDNCEITNACLINRNQAMGFGGWPATLSTFLDTSHHATNMCRNIIFSNNRISRSWGEGIAFVRTNGYQAFNNTIRDCFSCYIYSDNSRNGIIRNNRLYSTSDTFNITYHNGFRAPGVGIYWAAEGGGGYQFDSIVANIKIYNNLILRTGSAFGWFDDLYNNYTSDSYKNIEIYYNTVYNTVGYQSFNLDNDSINAGRVLPTGCKFMNNIICKAKYSIYREYFTNSNDYNTSWEIRNNCFIHGFPSGFSSNNIQGHPKFLDSSNSNSESNFKINDSSNCRNGGTFISGISKDYWNSNRSNTTPTIGFYEWTGQDKNLNLNIFLQGFYNQSLNTMISDTVKIYLRNASFPYGSVDSANGSLGTSGTGIFSFMNASNLVNYYLVLKHRNTIETWSSSVQLFTNSFMNYNFSTSSNKAYGNNQIQVDNSPLRFGIYSGDLNQDGVIDGSDQAKIDNDAFNFVTGYVVSDLNGDSVVDASDVVLVDNNGFNFVSVMRPR